MFRRARLWFACALLIVILASDTIAGAAEPSTHEEIRRYPAPEARQGIAVDDTFFYAITRLPLVAGVLRQVPAFPGAAGAVAAVRGPNIPSPGCGHPPSRPTSRRARRTACGGR